LLDEFAFASRKQPEYMHHRMVTCPTCDLLYASPAPPRERFGEAYEQSAFDSSEEAHFAARTYGQRLAYITSRIPDLEGALDIGTGDGAFLEQLLGAGFRGVVGVEPSTTAIRAARDDVRRCIRPGCFDPRDFPPASFSLVTCFQTLEHVWDPTELVRGMHGLLKPGGALYLVAHDRRSLSAWVLGLKSPIFDLEHLQLLSSRSLRELLGRCGFCDWSIQTIWNRYPLRYWLKLLPLGPAAKPGIALVSRYGLGRVALPLPAGNLAAVAFKR
jgi:SAM-dependent methyltransferase